MIRVGTSHYVSMSAIRAHYNGDPDSALAEGRVSVGRPVVAAGGKLFIDKQGRYIIYYPEDGASVVSGKSIPETPVKDDDEDTVSTRSHMLVEDLCRISIIWRFDSVFDNKDERPHWERQTDLDSDKESIESFINQLVDNEKKLTGGKMRWDIEDNYVGQDDGLVLICEAKHRSLMRTVAEQLIRHVDGLSCVTLTMNYRP